MKMKYAKYCKGIEFESQNPFNKFKWEIKKSKTYSEDVRTYDKTMA